MNHITINGKSYETKGNTISVQGRNVYVDGALIEEGLSGDVHISFDGPLANLKTSGSATVNGNVFGNVTADGSVQCQNIKQSIHAGGSVHCLNVSGDVDAGGSIYSRS